MLRLSGLHNPHGVTADVTLQAAAADGTSDLAIVRNEHVRTDATVGGATDADHACQGSNTVRPRNLLVREKDTFKLTHRMISRSKTALGMS